MARTANRKAILLDDVEHLGHRGEIVAVSRGYLRNYLVPRKLAEEATPARVREVEGLAATRAAQEARTAEQAHDIAALLTKTVLTIPARTGPDGRLYGGRDGRVARRRDAARARRGESPAPRPRC